MGGWSCHFIMLDTGLDEPKVCELRANVCYEIGHPVAFVDIRSHRPFLNSIHISHNDEYPVPNRYSEDFGISRESHWSGGKDYKLCLEGFTASTSFRHIPEPTALTIPGPASEFQGSAH